MKKVANIFWMVLFVTTYFTLPAWGSTTSQYPWGQSSLGQLYRKAAIVGQVISYNRDNDSYVVFGRLSIDHGAGYQVFEKRKFYRVYPKWGGSDDELAKKVGLGVKTFGAYESATGAGNEEKLLAERVLNYDPNTDLQAGIEPAYGAEIGPRNWIGFGVPVLTAKLEQMEVRRSSDVINQIVELKETLAIPNNSVIVVKEYAKHLLNGTASSGSTTEQQEKARRVRSIWQKTWSSKWFMEKDLNTNSEMQRAVQGTAFIYGQSGGVNGYIERVPVIRPDVDRFMDVIEKDRRVEFEEWAAPAIFYGLVSRIPDEDIIDQNSKTPKEFTEMNFTGVYYSDDNPRAMVDAIVDASQQRGIKAKEAWRIVGIPTKRVTELDSKPCWLSGQRILVYRHTYTDSQGKRQSELIDVFNGRIDEPNYTLVDHYIKPNKIITKPDYNFMVSLIREIAMQGGM